MADCCASVLLVLWIGVFSLASGLNEYCSSLPEMYFANVAGRISGGVNIIRKTDQTPCSERTYVDLRYRQVDGRCNHRMDYGSTFKPVKRYLNAHYQDKFGHNTPRVFSVISGYLPSAREVSRKIHPDESVQDDHTVWLMQIGQFIDHDITSSPVPTENNSSIKCCNKQTPELADVCFPIPIPEDDDRFDFCMEFVRSEPVLDDKGDVVFPREQINVLTSFVDGSSVYGNDEETLTRLRTKGGHGALLKTRLVNGKERLPLDAEAEHPMCLASSQHDSYCQLAGDKRVNEQPGLGSAHTAFHLYHNYIVRRIAGGMLRKMTGRQPNEFSINNFIDNAPQYQQEKIFQESRKILGGILQKIIYCDWLPLILGPDLITKFKLGCDRRSQYNPYIDPRIANGFLTAAFRFGHTLIPNRLKINNRQQELRDQFMIPDSTLNHFESIVKGMTEAGLSERYDRFISRAVTSHLFESVFGSKGALDLVALNIQRGRDHGIPAYYYWRRFYGLKRYTSFNDFKGVTNDIQSIYKHLLDVDLFTGGICEESVEGGVVGETFGHIIANQFADLKFGDAHFFLSKEVPQGFTSDQINSIMDVSLSSVLCAVNAMKSIQPNAFVVPNFNNQIKQCSSYGKLDTEPWMIYF